MLAKLPLKQLLPFAQGWLWGGSNEHIFPSECAVGIRKMTSNDMTEQIGLSCVHRNQNDAFIRG